MKIRPTTEGFDTVSTENPIRAARLRAGLSQGELARRAGISRQSLSYAETGAHRPQPGTIEKLAGALGVPADEITPRREDPAEREQWMVRGLLDAVEAGELSAAEAIQELRAAGILQPTRRTVVNPKAKV